jgi:hypothetical protein
VVNKPCTVASLTFAELMWALACFSVHACRMIRMLETLWKGAPPVAAQRLALEEPHSWLCMLNYLCTACKISVIQC